MVVAALVVVCLVLFSLYSRERGDGPLHGLQGSAGALVAPVQGVATKAVQPLRDLWGWANDLSDARDRAARLELELRELRSGIAEGRFEAEETRRINALSGIGDRWERDYAQVPAEIRAWAPSPYYHRAKLNVGTSEGVVRNSPVVAAGDVRAGLVGIITQASSDSSIVTFITEPGTGIGVTLTDADNAIGLLQPSTPGQMRISGIPRQAPVAQGQLVVTSGASQPISLPSPYPRGIPVGVVTGVGRQEVDVHQTVQVTPYVTPRELAYVVVLAPETERARRRAEG